MLLILMRCFMIYLDHLKKRLSVPIVSQHIDLLAEYHQNLFRLGIESTFKDINDVMFQGTITGVTQKGRLKVRVSTGVEREFDVKELQLQY